MKLSRQFRTDLAGYAFILPNIIGVFLFTLFPMLFSLFISFTDWDYTQGFGNWNFVGIDNFCGDVDGRMVYLGAAQHGAVRHRCCARHRFSGPCYCGNRG